VTISNALDNRKILGHWWWTQEVADSNHGKPSCRWRHVPLPVQCWFTLTILHPKKYSQKPSPRHGFFNLKIQKKIILAKKWCARGKIGGLFVECSILSTKLASGKKKITWFCRCTRTCPPDYAITCKLLNNLLPVWSNMSSKCPGPMSRCLAITNLFEAASITNLRVYVITQTWS
jgi:hypothetical protein